MIEFMIIAAYDKIMRSKSKPIFYILSWIKFFKALLELFELNRHLLRKIIFLIESLTELLKFFFKFTKPSSQEISNL